MTLLSIYRFVPTVSTDIHRFGIYHFVTTGIYHFVSAIFYLTVFTSTWKFISAGVYLPVEVGSGCKEGEPCPVFGGSTGWDCLCESVWREWVLANAIQEVDQWFWCWIILVLQFVFNSPGL